MRCAACGIDHPDGIRYCTQCGDALSRSCPACGAAAGAVARFCGQCGAAIDSPPKPGGAEPAPEAERRQLTVLFCDLVGSTVLSERLDPEDYREVVRAYQAVCGEVVERFDGHVAQYLGDGLLVYFGYPEAHEDDARRAVLAGLGIVDAISRLNRSLVRRRSLRVAVRLGVHTGSVVAGEVGAGKRRERLALGRTPNVAARLQGLAEPGQVLLSGATHRLVHGFFECQELGERSLKGVSQPMAVFRAVRDSGAQTRLTVAEKRGLTPLVGRDAELEMLLESFGRVRQGRGQAVLVTGEAGIGKSRLLRAFREELAARDGRRPLWLFCGGSPYHQSSAFHPLIELLQKYFRWHRDDSAEHKAGKLEAGLRRFSSPLSETVPLLGALLSLGATDAYPQLDVSPQYRQSRTLELLLNLLLEIADAQPVVFVMEDLHWADPSSLEFLELLLRQGPTALILTLLTARPSFDPPWKGRSHLAQLTLGRLTDRQIETMVPEIVGESIPDGILGQIVEKSDGIPLFVEELTKMLTSDLTDGLDSAVIPATVRDSLMARLDRLGSAKETAQLAAVVGRDFSYRILAAVSQLSERRLLEQLTRLVDAELIYQRGVPPSATFAFKHALIRDTAYRSLLKAARRRHHGRVARILERESPEAPEVRPELLAHHVTEAGRLDDAITYWRRAGGRDQSRGAYREASAHYRRCLEVIRRTPASVQRDVTELKVWLELSFVVGVAEGGAAPEVDEALRHAQQLASGMQSCDETFFLERRLWVAEITRPDFRKALEHGRRLAQLARSDREIHLAEHVLGTTRFYLGELEQARTHLETALEHDLANPACSFLSLALLSLGYLDQALARSRQAITLGRSAPGTGSQDLGDMTAYRHSEALLIGSVVHVARGERQAAWQRLEELRTSYHGKDLYMRRVGDFWHQFLAALDVGSPAPDALRQAADVDPETRIRRLQQAYVRAYSEGSGIHNLGALAMLVEACLKLRRVGDARRALEEALAIFRATGMHPIETTLLRLSGELALADAVGADRPRRQRKAESAFRQALEIARRQSNRLEELRAAIRLSRLWQSQGRRHEARDLLSEIYGWFTEGLDTGPLKEARELLDELS